MEILLAGPGTGKTTNIKNIISQHGNGKKFLVLSFTNATVKDLQSNLSGLDVSENNCMTLHKFAVKYNHEHNKHVLHPKEENELRNIEKGTGIEFDRLCDFLQCTTFDQMIERFVIFAKTNPLYLKQKLENFDSLIVDEYQDFNPYEQKLIDILINEIQKTYILGDDDQCIYDFKDASSDKIISFYTNKANSIIQHEHKCYRCPDEVVEHATHLIMNNKKRIAKKWDKGNNPGAIEYNQLLSFDEVASSIADKLSYIRDESILILSPVGFAVEAIAEKLKEKNIEFTNFFLSKIPEELVTKTWEVKSIFGNYKYLNLVLFGYSRLANRKKFYELVKKHYDTSKNYDELFELLINKLPNEIAHNELSLDEFLLLEEYHEIKLLFDKSEGLSADEKLENMLKQIEQDETKNIKIMSIHKSKGLGADYVFIVGLNEGILPNQKEGNDSLEAQRRVFYVGITRTKKQLFLYSNVQFKASHIHKVDKEAFKYNRKKKVYNGRASRFIYELNLENNES